VLGVGEMVWQPGGVLLMQIGAERVRDEDRQVMRIDGALLVVARWLRASKPARRDQPNPDVPARVTCVRCQDSAFPVPALPSRSRQLRQRSLVRLAGWNQLEPTEAVLYSLALSPNARQVRS
jgi:hypothetical protein